MFSVLNCVMSAGVFILWIFVFILERQREKERERESNTEYHPTYNVCIEHICIQIHIILDDIMHEISLNRNI